MQGSVRRYQKHTQLTTLSGYLLPLKADSQELCRHISVFPHIIIQPPHPVWDFAPSINIHLSGGGEHGVLGAPVLLVRKTSWRPFSPCWSVRCNARQPKQSESKIVLPYNRLCHFKIVALYLEQNEIVYWLSVGNDWLFLLLPFQNFHSSHWMWDVGLNISTRMVRDSETWMSCAKWQLIS